MLVGKVPDWEPLPLCLHLARVSMLPAVLQTRSVSQGTVLSRGQRRDLGPVCVFSPNVPPEKKVVLKLLHVILPKVFSPENVILMCSHFNTETSFK